MTKKPSYEELERRVAELEAKEHTFETVQRDLNRSKNFIESLLASIPAPVFWKDTSGRYQGCNAAFTEITGITTSQIRGKTVEDLWPGEHAAFYHKKDLELIANPRQQVYEFEVKDKQGKIRPVVYYQNVFRDENGDIAGLVGGFVDISDLRQVQVELETIFFMSLDLICIADINSATFLKINPAFTVKLGYTESELLSVPFTHFIHPEDIAPTRKVITESLQKGEKVINFKNRYRCKNGEYRWLSWVSHPVPEKGVTYAVAHDITEEIHAFETLRSHRDLLDSLFHNLPMGITIWDADGRLLKVNKAFTGITGYHMEDIVDLDHWLHRAYPDPDYRRMVSADWPKAKKSADPSREFNVTCHDGSVKDIDLSGTLLKDGRSLVTLVDITERKRAEEVLKRSEQLLKLYMEFTPAATAMCDLDMRYLAHSRRWITDYNLPNENFLGRCHYDVFKTIPEHWKRQHKRCLEGEIIDGEEEPFIRADRSVDWVRRSLHPWRTEDGQIGGLIMFTEVITEQKRAEEERQKLQIQLQRAQKMESIGTLAGGIAHNFNNILMGIQGRTSLMMLDKNSWHPDYEHLQGIEECVRSAVELTKDLLGFARGGRYEAKTTDLNELIKHENRIFGQTKREVKVRGKYEVELWPVEVDRGQIQQSLLNLYVNAWQAMPKGGDLYVQTENVILDEASVKPFKVAAGKYVKVSVTDTGVGMDSSILEKIFDPFFTTKEAGQGSGLGLASVYGIVKNHNGYITVYSEKGEGTTFNIFLPASEKDLVEEDHEPDRDRIYYGKGVVLLVDDEDMIIDVGRKMLASLGFDVLIARSGKQALEVYEKHRHEIDLVILDMIMPGMGGAETYDRLREIDEHIEVLLSSGYSINGNAEKIMDRGCSGFIQKPFSLNDLSIKIKKVLDEAKS